MVAPMNFGWIPPDQRTRQQRDANDAAIASMPSFRILGTGAETNKVLLWEFTKAINGGQHNPTFYQESGSCVGNGLGQAVWRLEAVEVARLGEREIPKCPFWLLPYGMSRYYLGERGPGEGSTGGTAAKAIREDGTMEFDLSGLPQPTMDTRANGYTWGKSEEMKWSDGGAIEQKWKDIAKKHLVKTTAECKSADDVREAIKNGYPLTCASDWGGAMKPPTKGGSNPVLLNSKQDTWQHQMSIHGWWDHPELSEIYYILNSWGQDVHGQPPDGSPPGGFWIAKKDMDYICRNGEVFALSQFDGFPAQDIPEMLFKTVGL